MGRVAVLLLIALGGLVALAVLAFVLVGGMYRAPSESMAPTIDVGDRFAVLEVGDPEVGDVVVFHPPESADSDPGQMCGGGPGKVEQVCAIAGEERSDVTFVKRVVGEGGDKLSMRSGKLIRNGKPESTDGPRSCDGEPCDFPGTIEVPRGTLYMLGDNRGASDDSRFWGPVPEDWVVGRYWFTLG
jgi:signal peptidase I